MSLCVKWLAWTGPAQLISPCNVQGWKLSNKSSVDMYSPFVVDGYPPSTGCLPTNAGKHCDVARGCTREWLPVRLWDFQGQTEKDNVLNDDCQCVDHWCIGCNLMDINWSRSNYTQQTVQTVMCSKSIDCRWRAHNCQRNLSRFNGI